MQPPGVEACCECCITSHVAVSLSATVPGTLNVLQRFAILRGWVHSLSQGLTSAAWQHGYVCGSICFGGLLVSTCLYPPALRRPAIRSNHLLCVALCGPFPLNQVMGV